MSTTSSSLNKVNIGQVGQLVNAINADKKNAATQWRSAVTWNGGFKASAKVRHFAPSEFDEPAVLGGADSAANPVEQLLSSLGACLAIGVAANATLLGVKIDSLTVDISGPIDLHTFLGLNPKGNAGFESINVSINLKSASSTSEQIAKVIESSTATSPVGHSLQRAIPIKYNVTHKQ